MEKRKESAFQSPFPAIWILQKYFGGEEEREREEFYSSINFPFLRNWREGVDRDLKELLLFIKGGFELLQGVENLYLPQPLRGDKGAVIEGLVLLSN